MIAGVLNIFVFLGFYPYGPRYSDKRLALINGYNAKLHLRRPMMFLSNHAQDLFVSEKKVFLFLFILLRISHQILSYLMECFCFRSICTVTYQPIIP